MPCNGPCAAIIQSATFAGVFSDPAVAVDFSALLDASLFDSDDDAFLAEAPSPSLELFGRLSVMYQPEPLKTTPTG